MKFTLPYPPSVNTYWRQGNGHFYISDKGKAYRVNVQAVAMQERLKAPSGPLSIAVLAYPPDRRVRDLDNLWKALLDSMVHAGIIESDCGRVLRREVLEWGEVDKPGRVEVSIQPYSPCP